MKAHRLALFASVCSCKICVLCGRNRWISWCIMGIAQLLARSVACDIRLVNLLGDCSKHCLTATMWFPVLTDRGPPRRPLLLYPVNFPSPWIYPGGALLWIWLERPCLESPSEIFFDFGQLISSRKRPLQFWSSLARNIVLLDPLILGNKTLEV